MSNLLHLLFGRSEDEQTEATDADVRESVEAVEDRYD